MNDHDENEELRALWARLEEPDAIDGDDRSRFPETEAVMATLRQAWSELEVPAAPSPKLGRRLEFPPALAAVAALILAFIGAFAFDWNPARDPRRSSDRLLGQGEVRPEVESKETRPNTNTNIVRRQINADGSLEMRKGRVRLLLVTPTPSSDIPESEEN